MKKQNIGFMQGRLSDLIEGKIQAFPSDNWKNEFREARSIDINLMEWTLDFENLYENPFMTTKGREEIIELSKRFSISIKSVTADCFMQKPFWKDHGENIDILKNVFIDVIHSCSNLAINYLVVPLVDNGKIENKIQENLLLDFFISNQYLINESKIMILFESDFGPKELKSFIDKLPDDLFGINYDIGNSAALGFETDEEFANYGKRIKNVHVKDRLLDGDTVELGEGNANFDKVFRNLFDHSYNGNFILQTARAKNNNHKNVLENYKELTSHYIKRYFHEK